MTRFLTGLLALLLSNSVVAQTLTKNPVSQGAVSFGDMTERLEKSAIQTYGTARKTAARGSAIDFSWPHSPDEYRALAKHAVVLVSVVSQDATELPLRRVYITVGGMGAELIRLSSQLSSVHKDSITFSVLGPYREHGFYLAPAGLMMREGYLQADFATNRTGFNLYKLPGAPPDFVKADSDPMPAPDAKPKMSAVRALLHREYRGYQLPASLR